MIFIVVVVLHDFQCGRPMSKIKRLIFSRRSSYPVGAGVGAGVGGLALVSTYGKCFGGFFQDSLLTKLEPNVGHTKFLRLLYFILDSNY